MAASLLHLNRSRSIFDVFGFLNWNISPIKNFRRMYTAKKLAVGNRIRWGQRATLKCVCIRFDLKYIIRIYTVSQLIDDLKFFFLCILYNENYGIPQMKRAEFSNYIISKIPLNRYTATANQQIC